MNPITHVYVVTNQSGMRKIGRARNVERRLAQLRTASAERLTLEFSMALSRYAAWNAEECIHTELTGFFAAKNTDRRCL